MGRRTATIVLAVTAAACAPPAPAGTTSPGPALGTGTATLVAAPTGFAGPEAVRYDPDQDIYFVGNMNGPGGDLDNNGFISRMTPDGAIDDLHWVRGGRNGVTLHAPRGMYITGDTLWVADADAVRGFHRRTGAPVATADFAGRDVGFLNDVAADASGALYVTDTGRGRVYRIAGRTITTALEDTALNRPNGITRHGDRFLIVPYGGVESVFAWRAGTRTFESVGSVGASRLDGVEVLADGTIIVAAQSDQTIRALANGTARVLATTAGRPADIAVDTRRLRVAVPFIALNQVEIWELPRR